MRCPECYAVRIPIGLDSSEIVHHPWEPYEGAPQWKVFRWNLIRWFVRRGWL